MKEYVKELGGKGPGGLALKLRQNRGKGEPASGKIFCE
jgi:hypothetical protein